MGGMGTTYYFLRRSGRPIKPLANILLTLSGGFAGSFLMIPVGIGMSRSSLRSVEDPQHMARALHNAMEQRRRVGGPPGPLTDTPTEETNESIDLPASEADWSTVNPSSSPDVSSSTDASGASAVSRWDELRRDRTSTPSMWEQIRQNNARNSLPPRSSNAPKEPQETRAPANTFSTFTTTEPPMPQTKNSDYERAVREYHEAMERERQGIDVTTGFTEKSHW
ncbi:hypothetical protein ACI68E_002168 [Malassezia pachydermatis]